MKQKIIYFLSVFIFLCFGHMNAQWIQPFTFYNQYLCSSVFLGDNILVGTVEAGIYFTPDGGDTWGTKNNGLTNLVVRAIINKQNEILFAGTLGGGVFSSINGGNSWDSRSNGITDFNVMTLNLFGSVVFAGTNAAGIFKSTDDGVSWQSANTGLSNLRIPIIASNESTLFAGTHGSGMFRSFNNGDNWEPINNGLGDNIVVRSIIVENNVVFAGTATGVFRSTNNGTSWQAVNSGLPFATITGLAKYNDLILAGTDYHGVYVSSDNGDYWVAANEGLGNAHVKSFLFTKEMVYMTTYGSGFFRRTLSSLYNLPIPVELTNFSINVAANGVKLEWSTATESNNMGFAIERSVDNENFIELAFINGNGTTTERKEYSYTDREATQGIYFYRLKIIDFDGSFVYSNVVSANVELPTNFTLNQNYPNPFNPTTTISFSLPAKEIVTLKIYDALGKEVASLYDEELQAGTYQTQWNASSVASGVYFYRLQAGKFSSSKKLMLIK
ncbi:MAG: T9SS type A sorting domain-containing protein [bacterium]